ncbi:MAG: CRISPR-associated endonuclease Cas1 [Spirochaetes bacterium]|nr:CRISPR-associated endonuclease Cas1 [Spirochaetota bacterium]
MQLVLNTFGCYLRKKEQCFLVKNEDRVFEVSAKKVQSIMITTSAFLSTDAVKLAMDNNIDIIFLDEYGNPYGRVWQSKLGSTTLIRRRQLEFAFDARGLDLAKEWIIRKFNNQIEFLTQLKNTRPEKASKITEWISAIQDILEKVSNLEGTIEEKRNSIMGYEGSAGRIYFEALSYIMPDRFKFEGRSRQPAVDEFNCLLNYGYGVLYSLVEKACIIGGLDPYVGFVHADNYNKKSLVFDLIEMFRILVDKTVVFLFSQRQVKKEYFDKIHKGLSLNKDGKAFFIEALNKTFEKTVRYRNRNIKNRDTIQFECHRIANRMIEDSGN